MSTDKEKILALLGPEPATPAEVMSVDNPSDLARAITLVDATFSDPLILQLYDAGDEARKSQTKHDRAHAFAVKDVGLKLLAEYDVAFPGKLDNWTRLVVIPLALFLHDVGSVIGAERHHAAGARIAKIYLTRLGFPPQVVHRICMIIAKHRSEQVLKTEFNDPAWAIVVIADKCVGDEDRVRPLQARTLSVLRFFRLAHRNWWHEAAHDRVNFAVKQARLIVDGNDNLTDGLHDAGAIVLQITLDEVVAPASEMTELYGKRFHACGRAAQYLGFAFRMEFNGCRWMYDKSARGWRPICSIEVPLP